MTPDPGPVAAVGDGGDCGGGEGGGSGACDGNDADAVAADAVVDGDDGDGDICGGVCAATIHAGPARSPAALSLATLAHSRFDYGCSEMRRPATRDPRPETRPPACGSVPRPLRPRRSTFPLFSSLRFSLTPSGTTGR